MEFFCNAMHDYVCDVTQRRRTRASATQPVKSEVEVISVMLCDVI